jgi:hypothetical protein
MMELSSASRRTLSILVSAGILAGCSGSQSIPAPSAAVNASSLLRVTPDDGRHETVAYIVNFGGGGIQEYRFPKGELLHHPISGGGGGMCSRTNRGDFWVVNSNSETLNEYKAGGTKVLKTVSLASYGDPAGCAVSHTDDLAASLMTGDEVVVFSHATGSGTEYHDALEETFFATYDSSGDLFVNGFNSEFIPAVSEMPAGSSSFHIVSLPNSIEFPGNIQWDGTYVTVNDQEAYKIYQYTVSGSSATLEGTVSYSGASDCDDTWIFRGYFLCPDYGDGNAKVYAYPAGGSPLYTWSGNFDEPIGAFVIEK